MKREEGGGREGGEEEEGVVWRGKRVRERGKVRGRESECEGKVRRDR